MADEQNKNVVPTQAEQDANSLADTANPVTPQEAAEMEAQFRRSGIQMPFSGTLLLVFGAFIAALNNCYGDFLGAENLS